MVIYQATDSKDRVMTKVQTAGEWVFLTCSNLRGIDTATLRRDEAIAAARAILAHYKETAQ